MKKLLQINSLVNIGSTGRIAEEIGELVMNNGWESYIAYGRGERLSKSETVKIGTNLDTKIHALQTRIFDNHGSGSKKATENFIKQIKQINPDIIHLHNIHGYYLNIEVLFKYLGNSKIPVVWTLHDCWSYTGHCAYYSFVKCEKWKTECNHCPQKGSYPAGLFLDNSKKNFIKKKELFNSVNNLTVIPVSNWLANDVKHSFLSDYNIKVINNGINLNVFDKKESSDLLKKFNLKGKFVILGVANVWDNRKGLKDFILLSKHLKNDESVILVGLNKHQLKNLPANIIGIQRTESTIELAEFYNLADVYLNPTWEDNFPTTNLESLACGTPVITYDTGGSPEAISCDTGFIVEQGNVLGVIDKIRMIKKKRKEFFTQNCRERAIKFFNKEEKYLEYLNLYIKKINNEIQK